MKEFLKKIVYSSPVVKRILWPRYKYKISPGQLISLLEVIDATKKERSSILEIGVAKGDTSTFILEHLKVSEQSRPVFFLDTFNGFSKESIEVEVRRGKPRGALNLFRYGNERVFTRSLHAAGYEGFKVISGDAAKFDYALAAPIGAVLLDIDVYKPTLECLHAIWPHLSAAGGIVVDDCLPNSLWDGSLQAVEEFCISMHIIPIRVGGKGMLIRKPVL